MRLIDADTLIDTLYDHEFASYIDKGEVSTVINDEPTVDAIPVEWIKEKISNNKGFYNSSLRRLLDEWAERKEE